jgi:2-keto-4-pentenoate hydratase/2-oxohepta-3-ene-1,7-dioic acid hydratase in catechol pathway
MRVANYEGRLALIVGSGVIDVESASSGAFSADPQGAYENWPALCDWASGVDGPTQPLDESKLGAPVPRPRQVFGIGLNYRQHADEVGAQYPEFPATFTKFPSCLVAPNSVVELPSESVDWEVELVVVVGREARFVDEADGWSFVAGLTVGQDLSERVVQSRPPSPQWSLGKSFAGFGPTGPCVVTPDELADPDNLAISCALNGEVMQSSRTNDLIFNVPALINRLSSIVTLFPGDLIFTGTPSGVGVARKPQRFLKDGDHLVSTIEGIGTMAVSFASRAAAPQDRAAAHAS